eukprot:scaffold1239_cov130-Cylindrotheca_fusiformis.AAC.1
MEKWLQSKSIRKASHAASCFVCIGACARPFDGVFTTAAPWLETFLPIPTACALNGLLQGRKL